MYAFLWINVYLNLLPIFKSNYLFSFLVNYRSSSNILVINPFGDIEFAKIFSNYTDCLLLFLIIFFTLKSFVFCVWYSPTYLILFCFLCFLVSYPLPRPTSRSFAFMFSSRNFTILDLTFKSLIHLSWFLCKVWNKDPFSSFCV